MNKIVICVLLFVLSFVIISINLNKPFIGEHDWNGVRYGNIARNYLKYGFWETQLGQIENSGPATKEEFEYFTHYPPLLPILISLSYKIFGISEWSTRLVAVLASSGIIVLIYLIATKLWNIKYGILASLVALVTPLVLYFGKNPVHESLVVFFVLLAYFSYLQGHKKLFFFSLILAEFSTWAGYFLVPAITFVALLKKDFKEAKALLPFWLLSMIIFFIHIGHTALLTGSILGGNLFESLLQRTSVSREGGPQDLNFFNYLFKLESWFVSLYTATLTLLALAFIINRLFSFVTNRKFIKFTSIDWSIITLGLFGVTYLILFPNAAFIHNYLIFYLLPFFCLAAISIIKRILDNYQSKIFNIFFCLIILTLIFYERKDFLMALSNSNGDKFSVEVGKAISNNSKYEDTILITPRSFSFSADKFLRFYSDRKLVYADSINIDHNVLVIVDEQSKEFKILQND